MIKEAKEVDFFTTGQQPSELDFARISEWIKKDKQAVDLNDNKKKAVANKKITVCSSSTTNA